MLYLEQALGKGPYSSEEIVIEGLYGLDGKTFTTPESPNVKAVFLMTLGSIPDSLGRLNYFLFDGDAWYPIGYMKIKQFTGPGGTNCQVLTKAVCYTLNYIKYQFMATPDPVKLAAAINKWREENKIND